MAWKGREEPIKAGDRTVWAGLLPFALGPFIVVYGTGSELTLMRLMNSAQSFGIGLILIGSVVLLIGRLREDRPVGSVHLGTPTLSYRPDSFGENVRTIGRRQGLSLCPSTF